MLCAKSESRSRNTAQQKGITQEQLGNLAGVTCQAVSKWERGGVPDAELLPSQSRALDVSIDTLFGLKEPAWSD